MSENYQSGLLDVSRLIEIMNRINDLEFLLMMAEDDDAIARIQREMSGLSRELEELDIMGQILDLFLQQNATDDEDDFLGFDKESDQESEEDHD